MLTKDCDIVIQAGHENTPDGATGGSGPLGNEIDWTPIVANEAVAILQAAGVPAGFTATPIKTVKATQFGKGDRQDEGTGAPVMGTVQTNSDVVGASVKISVMAAVFGADWRRNAKRNDALIEVYFKKSRRLVRVPLVDVGPGENAPSHAEVDLTLACDQFLKTDGLAIVDYRLLVPKDLNPE